MRHQSTPSAQLSLFDVKRCPRCGYTKARSEFAKHHRQWDGLQAYCRSCMTIMHRKYFRTNSERMLEYQRDMYAQKVDLMRQQARDRYYKRREDPEKLARMRLLKLDTIHRRDAKQAEPDHETLAYMELLRNDPCSYCGKMPAGTVDHIVPLDDGGAHHWSNLTAACETCNKSKQTKSLLEFLMFRMKLPSC